MTPALAVEGLSVGLRLPGRILKAVDGVGFLLAPGACLGVLGESGSGKSVLLRSLMGLTPLGAVTEGSLMIGGETMSGASEAAWRARRGRTIAMVFQDPMTGFDPTRRIGAQIIEAIRVSRPEAPNPFGLMRDLLSLARVAGVERCAAAYPHELSGGLRQRCMIAMALAGDPKVLLADEPTTALDVSVQAQVLDLLNELRRERALAIVFVTHDIGVLMEVADEIAVMYAGRFVETGPMAAILKRPFHPYTGGLLNARITLGHRGRRAEPIAGAPPSLDCLPPGCAFRVRCPRALPVCGSELPPLAAIGRDRRVACHSPSPLDA